MKKLEKFGKTVLGAVIGFFTPYAVVGLLSFMGSIDYSSVTKSSLFVISVICCTSLGVMVASESSDDDTNLRPF